MPNYLLARQTPHCRRCPITDVACSYAGMLIFCSFDASIGLASFQKFRVLSQYLVCMKVKFTVFAFCELACTFEVKTL